MTDPRPALAAFLRRYEAATNTHDFERIAPLICADATYVFSEDSLNPNRGIEEIRAAIEQTFATIQDEVYEISDVEWVAVSAELAVCTYRFSWQGRIDGEPASGQGRGTNVITRRDGDWRMLYEHLST
ncbi:YybH family protein [Flindersiella endophytica]